MNRTALFVLPILLTVVVGCRFMPKETVQVNDPPKTAVTESALKERLTAKGVKVEKADEMTRRRVSPLQLTIGFDRSNSSFILNNEKFEPFTALLAKLKDIYRDRELSGIFNEGTNDIAMKLTIQAKPEDLANYQSKGIYVEDFEKLVDDLKKENFTQIELSFSDSPAYIDLDEPPPTPKSNKATKVISGGIINGKASNLVKPSYPEAARAVRASGAVNVKVLVDEKGSVIEAEAVSGHPLLRASAVQAARASKFIPTQLAGEPVRVSGTVVFTFAP